MILWRCEARDGAVVFVLASIETIARDVAYLFFGAPPVAARPCTSLDAGARA